MIANGHPPATAWNYTPRELAGWMEFAKRRLAGERLERMTAATTSARGSKEALETEFKRLQKESA